MIQLTYKSAYSFNVTTEDVRIDTSVPSSQIRHLFKFTNDMSGRVKYAYARTEIINDRYTSIVLTHSTSQSVVSGRINFVPNGFWKYEVYEVSFNGTPVISLTTVPLSETGTATDQSQVFGTVKGCVEVGKLFVAEESGEEQVQYTQREEPSSSNYIYYGQ
jgi:hypothetical protein